MALLGEVGRCRGWGQPVGLGSAIVAPELNHGLEPMVFTGCVKPGFAVISTRLQL